MGHSKHIAPVKGLLSFFFVNIVSLYILQLAKEVPSCMPLKYCFCTLCLGSSLEAIFSPFYNYTFISHVHCTATNTE